MPLTPGTKLGPYEILNPIGAGGMGEVYRAKDTKLDRTVAVKVLPDDVSHDPERLSRFEREAKAVAALSHPNILAIHDLGTAGGTAYAVMELLEGDTLRDRLQEGLGERKSVEVAAQMARGLGAAHEKGIVHRDLKPENVFITQDGQVKILDFGLAKINLPHQAETMAKTMGSSTEPGKVMGTIGYMSPEQVQGQPVDHRSDIFSFGILLYEMLTGRRAFERDSAVETMTAILREEPEKISESGQQVPPALDRVVQRCLEKKPGERFQSARDLAFALENASETSVSTIQPALSGSPPSASRSLWWRVITPVVVFGLGVLAGMTLLQRLNPPVPTQQVQVRMLTFSGSDAEPTVSPDGRMVAFRSDRDGRSRIWVKQLSGGGEAPLTAGPDASPRFSPDGSSLLFLRAEGASSSAYRIALVGGDARKIIDDVTDIEWSPDGNQISFQRTLHEEATRAVVLGIADASGNNERELVKTSARALNGMSWSEDGQWLAVASSLPTGNSSDSLLMIHTVTGEQKTLAPADNPGPISPPTWSGAEQILFAQAGSSVGDQSGALSRIMLMDVKSQKETTLFWSRNIFPVLGGGLYHSRFEILEPGVLVFNEMVATQNLREIDLAPGNGTRAWARGNSRDRQPAYSPDGREIVFSSNRSGNLDLWVLSRETGAVRQLTDDKAQDWDPAFTPDGKSILWSSDRGGNLEIWTANVDGTRARKVTSDGEDAENPTATPDGWVVYWSGNPDKLGVWKIRMDGSEATRLVAGAHYGTDVSPDGKFAIFNEPLNLMMRLRVVEVATGEVPPFRIDVPFRVGSAGILWGRSRWMSPEIIAFVGENEAGAAGVYTQQFSSDKDTGDTRRPLAGFFSDTITESFDISPDGSRVVLSTLTQTYNLMMAEDVPGVVPPGWQGER